MNAAAELAMMHMPKGMDSDAYLGLTQLLSIAPFAPKKFSAVMIECVSILSAYIAEKEEIDGELLAKAIMRSVDEVVDYAEANFQ